MYTLTHDGEIIGTTKLERGDPSTHSVSGTFYNIGGAKALSGWIKSIGGQEDDGIVYSVLNKDFSLADADKNTIEFKEGTLISVPAEDEAYLDISGITEDDYKTYFSGHISALNNTD